MTTYEKLRLLAVIAHVLELVAMLMVQYGILYLDACVHDGSLTVEGL